MSRYPKLEGRIKFDSATVLGTVSGSTITIPAGEYYLTTGGTLANSLLAEIEAQILAIPILNADVSLDDNVDVTSTGKVTISADTSFTITWNANHIIRDILGFTADVASTDVATGANQATHLWLPDVRRTNTRAAEVISAGTAQGMPISSGIVTETPGGATRAIAYPVRYEDNLEFAPILGHKTWKALEIITNQSLEKFWDTVIVNGYPVRYHPDRADDSVRFTYRVGRIGDMGAEQMVPGWIGQYSHWRWGSRVMKYTTGL